MRNLIKLLTTFFYMGEVPFAPGTVGSFAGLLLFLSLLGHQWVGAVVFLVLLFIGFFYSGEGEKIFGKKDPSEVVIDEVCGVFIVFFMVPITLLTIVGGFILYRLLDIIKPFPARQLERLEGGYGIMLDDIFCGIYANLIIQILLKLNIISKV